MIGSAPRPLSHHWRVEDGEWVWFVPKIDPCEGVDSPVGLKFKVPCKDGVPIENANEVAEKQLKEMISANEVRPDQFLKRVQISSSSASLSATVPSEAEITITNNFAGPLDLSLVATDLAGLTLKLDPAKVEPNSAAKLRLSYQPGKSAPPGGFDFRVHAEPLNLNFPIHVTFGQ
jgi:hypothetical protein